MTEQIWIAILSSTSLATIVTAIVNAIITNTKRYKSLETANRLILKDRIKHLGKSYIQRGSITIDELKDLHEMHECYHNELKGNGFLDTLMEEIDRLPKSVE